MAAAQPVVHWCLHHNILASMISVTFLRNCIRAAMLDVEFYNEAETTPALTKQAGAVVVISTALSGLGAAFATEGDILPLVLAGAVSGVIGWLVWSSVALVVGTRAFSGDADYGQMLRVIGFSYVPNAIGVIPWLGFVGAAWAFFAALIGIREGMDFTTVKAALTLIAGWGAWLGLTILVQAVIGLELISGWPL